MATISVLISLSTLFYLLGKSAGLVIDNIRIIAEKLGIRVFFLGLILGIFTSLPELAIGVNAVINNVPSIAVGNLMGEIIVLFSLVLGLGVVLNRKIASSEKINSFILIFIYLLLPLFLGIKGYLGPKQGIVLIIFYFLLIFYLYRHQKHYNFFTGVAVIKNEKLLKNVFLTIVGVALTVVISNVIIRLSEILLNNWRFSPFVIGLIFFSIGTSLPEIAVTLKSWRRNIKELSISNLIGSAIANILVLGFLAFVKPINLEINLSYYALLLFMVLLFSSILFFYRTGWRLVVWEGWALIGIYLLFIFSQFIFSFPVS